VHRARTTQNGDGSDDGGQVTARFLVTAVGCLSTTNLPDFPGRDTFRGDWYHTGVWPHEGVDFTGKQVAVIGTGATGVQAIPEIAEQAAHVYVLQRTPNYDIAGGNRPMTAEDGQQIKANYRDIWQATRETAFGFPYDVADRTALSVSEEERQRIFAEAWERGGFRLGTTFNDLLLDVEANETASEFLRARIRERVQDPEIAELLSPRDHPFFTKRPPLENGYYETFNRGNVTLVNVRKSPIQEITPYGVRTADAEYEVDIIVYATGFDAMTGTLFKLGIRGRNGLGLRSLRRRCCRGPTPGGSARTSRASRATSIRTWAVSAPTGRSATRLPPATTTGSRKARAAWPQPRSSPGPRGPSSPTSRRRSPQCRDPGGPGWA
jgi:cation diffusion facilitator CzcD-associated flavoprotein CzcO